MNSVALLRKSFKNPDLFDLALTHRSWINENRKVRRSNERLEFLGDAVLEFVVSNEIYNRFSDKEEGYLTALRANLVNTQNLAGVARKLELGREIFLSRGEDEGGGRDNASLLADTTEAIIGALFLDQGIKAAEEFIKTNLLSGIEEKLSQPLKDAKSRLQELVQAEGFSTPKYRVVEESGPDHAKIFIVEVLVGETSLGKGQGKSKNEAEQQAAVSALAAKGEK